MEIHSRSSDRLEYTQAEGGHHPHPQHQRGISSNHHWPGSRANRRIRRIPIWSTTTLALWLCRARINHRLMWPRFTAWLYHWLRGDVRGGGGRMGRYVQCQGRQQNDEDVCDVHRVDLNKWWSPEMKGGCLLLFVVVRRRAWGEWIGSEARFGFLSRWESDFRSVKGLSSTIRMFVRYSYSLTLKKISEKIAYIVHTRIFFKFCTCARSLDWNRSVIWCPAWFLR